VNASRCLSKLKLRREIPPLHWLAFLVFVLALPCGAGAQLSTSDHLQEPGFWPTKLHSSLEGFAGSAACEQCHKEISAAQRKTPMARTLSRADGNAVLRDHPDLGFDHRQYKFRISTANGKSTYSVSDGKEKITAVLNWAFGLGQVGQSYVYERNGAWYEARATFFPTLNNLEFTPTRALDAPQDVAEAMARPLGSEEMRRCFQCHATGVTTKPIVEQSQFTNGLSCEACHGPGGKHVAAKRAEKLLQGEVSGASGGEFIFNPRKLSPADSVDFCGACHATWWDVQLAALKGVPSIRSQPYRLQNSKCWGPGDPRITCIACHDPHQQLEKRAEMYDPKCLACHVTGKGETVTATQPGKPCPVATSKCSSCHMPKIEIREMHYSFADHDIRIVRPGAPLPD
jgi:Cytochrome c554 and c-prime